MKTWLCSLLLITATLCAHAQAPSARIGGKPAADLSSLVSTIPAGSARHAEGTAKQVVPGAGILFEGGYYDFAPGEVVPQGNVKMGNITLPAFRAKLQSFAGVIFIRGVGAGMVDRADWEGMIEPDGTFSYRTALGAVKTVAAFKLSTAADPIAEFRAKSAAR